MDWIDDLLPSDFHREHPVKEFAVRYHSEAREGQRPVSYTHLDVYKRQPRGRAKGMYPTTYEKWSVSLPIRSIHCFTTTQQTCLLYTSVLAKSPYLVILGGVTVGVVVLIKKRKARKAAKKAAKQNPTEESK